MHLSLNLLPVGFDFHFILHSARRAFCFRSLRSGTLHSQPWLKVAKPKAPGAREYLQTKDDRAKLDGMYECILCACCQTSCPSYCTLRTFAVGGRLIPG